jgi:hypothetical protein
MVWNGLAGDRNAVRAEFRLGFWHGRAFTALRMKVILTEASIQARQLGGLL